MVLMLGEDQSFNISGYITTPGYNRTILKGYIVSQRPDGTYVAPLIPQLFYGADGKQLTTWRQYFSQTGSQTILSRNAGNDPYVPPGELYWKKLPERGTGRQTGTAGPYRSGNQRTETERAERHLTTKTTLADWFNELSTTQKVFLGLTVIGTITGIASLIIASKKR